MNRLIAALTPADRARLLPSLREAVLERGRVLYEAGARIDQIYFPVDAVIALISQQEDGDAVEVGAIGREGVVAIDGLLGDRVSFSRAVVQLGGLTLTGPVGVLLDLWENSPDFRRVLTAYNHAFAALVSQSVACNATHNAEMRLARWLLEVIDRTPTGDTLTLTHEYLAEMLGVGRPTITVVARELQAAGLIRYARGAISVLDRPGLEAAACECYPKVRAAFDRLLPGSFRR